MFGNPPDGVAGKPGGAALKFVHRLKFIGARKPILFSRLPAGVIYLLYNINIFEKPVPASAKIETCVSISTEESLAAVAKYTESVSESGNEVLTAYVEARLSALGG